MLSCVCQYTVVALDWERLPVGVGIGIIVITGAGKGVGVTVG